VPQIIPWAESKDWYRREIAGLRGSDIQGAGEAAGAEPVLLVAISILMVRTAKLTLSLDEKHVLGRSNQLGIFRNPPLSLNKPNLLLANKPGWSCS
jgi:hypothetical protein